MRPSLPRRRKDRRGGLSRILSPHPPARPAPQQQQDMEAPNGHPRSPARRPVSGLRALSTEQQGRNTMPQWLIHHIHSSNRSAIVDKFGVCKASVKGIAFYDPLYDPTQEKLIKGLSSPLAF